MPIEHWLAFVVAASILLVIPGPTILTVISYSITHGRKASLLLVTGVALGDATAIALSMIGLGALLATSAWWFTAIKTAGGLYLIFLGLKMLRAKPEAVADSAAAIPASQLKLLGNTYLVTALNPKGIVFFVAFLPQFVSPGGNVTGQLWLLAITFVVLAIINAACYSLCAVSARRVMTAAPTRTGFSIGGGILLISAGFWSLLARRAG